MNISSRASVLWIFLLLPMSNAYADCFGNWNIESDGSIKSWPVCEGGLQEVNFQSDVDRFSIDLYVGDSDDPEELNWRSVGETRSDGREFRAENSTSHFELIRETVGVYSGGFDHVITVRNLSPSTTQEFRLRMNLGRALQLSGARSTGFAQSIYSFKKALIVSDGGEWERINGRVDTNAVALYSRHRILSVTSSDTFASGKNENSSSSWFLEHNVSSMAPNSSVSFPFSVSVDATSIVNLENTVLADVMYADLWRPLASLCRVAERAISMFSSWFGSVGSAVLLLALAIRIATLPVTSWANVQQKQFASISAVMDPEIAAARESLKGAEQSERILAIYKEHGISPFSGLKGSLGLFVQIPFLLAVFHVTTESSVFYGSTFLGIADLSVSDSLLSMPFAIPVLGDAINLLPLALGFLNIYSGKRDSELTGSSMIAPVLISCLIVVLFYSVSAALVIYWLAINVLQSIEKKMFGRGADNTLAK